MPRCGLLIFNFSKSRIAFCKVGCFSCFNQMSAKICGLSPYFGMSTFSLANILEVNQLNSIFRTWIQGLDCNFTHWNHKTKLSACTIVPEMLNSSIKRSHIILRKLESLQLNCMIYHQGSLVKYASKLFNYFILFKYNHLTTFSKKY